MDTDPDLASILGGGAGHGGAGDGGALDEGPAGHHLLGRGREGTTMSSFDSATGQTVLHHWGGDGSSVALVYDPWGVVIGAEVLSATGDVVQVSGDGVADVVTDLALSEDLPLSCPWGDDGMVCQAPLDADRMTVDDITSSDAYLAWLEDVAGEEGEPGEPGEDEVVGDVGDADFWFEQSTDFTCGPAAATQIIEDVTGVDLADESVVATYALDQGWLSGDGMDSYRLAELLTDFGVPATVESDQTWQDIAGYLAEGRSVVMTVDAYDYWDGAGGGDEPEDSASDGINHFVRVVAIDVDRGVAVLSDTGTPDGHQLEVPLAALEEGWDDVTSVDELGNPQREHLLVVSDSPDPTAGGRLGGTGGAGARHPAAAGVRGDLADLGGGRVGADAGLFGNPHGWVIVPAVLALSRLAAVVRR